MCSGVGRVWGVVGDDCFVHYDYDSDYFLPHPHLSFHFFFFFHHLYFFFLVVFGVGFILMAIPARILKKLPEWFTRDDTWM